MQTPTPTPAALEDRRRLVVSQLRMVAGSDGRVSRDNVVDAITAHTLELEPGVFDREDGLTLTLLVRAQLAG